MQPLIDKAKLLQSLVDTYDVEGGQSVSTAKIYKMIRAQKVEEFPTTYFIPTMDGDGMRCEACNTDFDIWTFIPWNFCPSCGANILNSDYFERDDKGYWRIKHD